MALPGGAQAEDKTQSARRKVGLVRVRHDGGIEKGSRFQREFANEIRTDQQLSLFGNLLICQYEVADLFEPFQKGPVDLLVSPREFSGHFVQEWPYLAFRERHDPGDNPACSLGSLRSERAQKYAGLVGPEDRGRASHVHRGSEHGLVIPVLREAQLGGHGQSPVHFSTVEYTTPVRGLPHSKQHVLNRDVINPHDGHILCVPYPAIWGFTLLILRSSRIVNSAISRASAILVACIEATLLGEFRIERVGMF